MVLDILLPMIQTAIDDGTSLKTYGTYAVENASFPYLVIVPIGGFPDAENTGSTRLERESVLFSVFSTSDTEAARLIRLLEKALLLLPVKEANFVSSGLEKDPDQTNEGLDVYIGRLVMEFVLQTTPSTYV